MRSEVTWQGGLPLCRPAVVLGPQMTQLGKSFRKVQSELFEDYEDPLKNAFRILQDGLQTESLEVTFASNGGWIPFGPERIVTKSKGNILFELDDKPALDLYKNYLGEKSKDLPSSALLYPLKVKSNDESIVLHCYNYRPEEDLLADVYGGYWIRSWAVAESKMIIAEARSKFSQIAGPQGGTTLNGEALRQDAATQMDKLEQELVTYADGGDPLHFVIG